MSNRAVRPTMAFLLGAGALYCVFVPADTGRVFTVILGLWANYSYGQWLGRRFDRARHDASESESAAFGRDAGDAAAILGVLYFFATAWLRTHAVNVPGLAIPQPYLGLGMMGSAVVIFFGIPQLYALTRYRMRTPGFARLPKRHACL